MTFSSCMSKRSPDAVVLPLIRGHEGMGDYFAASSFAARA